MKSQRRKIAWFIDVVGEGQEWGQCLVGVEFYRMKKVLEMDSGPTRWLSKSRCLPSSLTT